MAVLFLQKNNMMSVNLKESFKDQDTTAKLTNPTPLVSIMMTTFNRADLIGEAIKSVLGQTYQNWELLILDDGSIDDTATVVSDFVAHDSRIKYFPAPQNLGITKNRNRGLELSIGKYIAVLDSDDFWCDATKLEKQVSYLEAHADTILIGTQTKVVDESSNTIDQFSYATNDTGIRKKLFLRNQFTHSSIIFRMQPGLKYDENISIWEDYELILRLGAQGKLANLPEVMTAYRKHATNISRNKKISGAKTHLEIIKKYKGKYPNYWLAFVKRKLKYLF